MALKSSKNPNKHSHCQRSPSLLCRNASIGAPSSSTPTVTTHFVSPSCEGSRSQTMPFWRRRSCAVHGANERHGKEKQKQGYGPRLIVRNIKRIKMGQEITIAYTDLLQSKAMRQLDLWSKYRFIYCYERCSVVPFTYVDHALQVMVVDAKAYTYDDEVIKKAKAIGKPGLQKLDAVRLSEDIVEADD
ncbi:Protein SET DOMAIN GROUP [Arachis hypogaea]|nr:Protein SET DOMAIN GROUP [Arachis hypogaea]